MTAAGFPKKLDYLPFQMEALTDGVQGVFRDLVMRSTWLTNVTKALADEKIKAIIHNIGYPDFLIDDVLLQSEIEGVRQMELFPRHIILMCIVV